MHTAVYPSSRNKAHFNPVIRTCTVNHHEPTPNMVAERRFEHDEADVSSTVGLDDARSGDSSGEPGTVLGFLNQCRSEGQAAVRGSRPFLFWLRWRSGYVSVPRRVWCRSIRAPMIGRVMDELRLFPSTPSNSMSDVKLS